MLAAATDLLMLFEALDKLLEASTLAWLILLLFSTAKEWLDFESEEIVAVAAEESEEARLEADFEPV